MNATRQCRICNAHAATEEVGLVSNGYPLYRCASCQSVMIERQPQSDELVHVYDKLFASGSYTNYRQEFEKLSRGGRPSGFYRAKLLRRVGSTCAGRELVKIGGGTGSFGVLASR